MLDGGALNSSATPSHDRSGTASGRGRVWALRVVLGPTACYRLPAMRKFRVLLEPSCVVLFEADETNCADAKVVIRLIGVNVGEP